MIPIMYQSINIDKAAEHVKHIIDANRCAICDKTNGIRMRYPCGHTSCEDCVAATESCLVCLTPQNSSTFATPSIDKPLTQRSQNANTLLNAFQTEFNIDVYKRHRISEQLKVEKELFPHCIQAPAKYYNKRKSSKDIAENKENTITVFPGEKLSPLSKMENSNANVREWLNNCVKRKPLGDLNHTRTKLNKASLQKQLKQHPLKPLNTQNIPLDRSNRKRNHSKIWVDENETFHDETIPIKKHGKEISFDKLEIIKSASTKLQKSNKDDCRIPVDDSVIVIDDTQSVRIDKDTNAWLAVLEAVPIKKHNKEISFDKLEIIKAASTKLQNGNKDDCEIAVDDSVIVIDESQSVRVDKDMSAWLAVLEANKNEQCGSTTLGTKSSEKITEPVKVLFYVKSPLWENCKQCNDYYRAVNEVSEAHPNVSITVENSNFTAIINVSKLQNATKMNAKQSVEVQTDFNKETMIDEGRVCKDEIIQATSLISSRSKSEDTFLGEANKYSPVNKSSNVVIAESDSDGDLEHSTSLLVTADVHRPYDDLLVLGDVEDLREHSKRPRRTARGLTPTSTDSSDKENYNPNRKKRSVNSKKKPVKK